MTSLYYYLQSNRKSLQYTQTFITIFESSISLTTCEHDSILISPESLSKMRYIDYLFLDYHWYHNKGCDITYLTKMAKYIIINDTNNDVSKDLYKLLNSDFKQWKLIKNNPFEENGWSAFERI